MNRIEDRLRDAFGAVDGAVRPIRGLPVRPRARPRRGSLAPLAAAAAVAVVIATVFGIVPVLLPGHQNAAPHTPGAARAANGKIVFVRLVSGGHWQLWAVNPDGSDLAPLTALPRLNADPSFAPDGKKLVFAHAPRFASPPNPPTPLWNLYAISSTGTGLRQLTHCRPPGCWQDYEPAWSPQRSRIAFVRNQDIYLINANGTGLRRLTRAATPLGDGQPAWSPTGRMLAFVVVRALPARLPAIYVMNADGTHIRRLTRCRPGCIQAGPAWSPDGTKIAFSGNQDIYTMSPAGRDLTRLTDCAHIAGCVDAGGPVWSPDGREIAFWVEGHDSNRQPYLMDANGSHVRPLIPKGADVCCLAWQPLPLTRPTRTAQAHAPATVTAGSAAGLARDRQNITYGAAAIAPEQDQRPSITSRRRAD